MQCESDTKQLLQSVRCSSLVDKYACRSEACFVVLCQILPTYDKACYEFTYSSLHTLPSRLLQRNFDCSNWCHNWCHNPDRSPSGDWPHRQTPQCHFRPHRQDAEQCPSTSGPKLPGRLVSCSTPGSFVEASSRSSSETMAGPDPWRQPTPPSRCVERRCQTRSSWSDATVLDDYALTTTTNWCLDRRQKTRDENYRSGELCCILWWKSVLYGAHNSVK